MTKILPCVESLESMTWRGKFYTNWGSPAMNVEEVCAMIDAITEGRPFELDVPVPVGEDALNLRFNSDEISILGSRGFATAVRNPRNAREIAAALTAWANRKDGIKLDGFADNVTRLTRGDTIEHKTESSIAPEVADAQLYIYRKGLGNV
jgi:hypothetical protein